MLALRDMPLADAGIDLEFRAGAITVVLGRNGSGRTRLCRLIAGLDHPVRGAIELDGVDITPLPPGRRSVAFVQQAFVNYPNLTVFENIASPLRARRSPAAEVRRRVAEIAGSLRIGELLGRLPAELSGGQQQRVAIGRALAKSARVLLLDEPLVNLDYKLREALEFELRELLHAAGLTVIYTTSDPRDAFNLADEVVLLERHRVLQRGAPLDVYERPVSAAAANLMSDPGVNRLSRGERETVVRPEHLRLERPAAAARRFELDVLGVETNGSETYLHGVVDGAHWVAKLPGLHRVATGGTVAVYAPVEAVIEFAETPNG
jgi:glycerol transport system ATP-binding protein